MFTDSGNAAAGLRRDTFRLRRAEALADSFGGLAPGMTRWRLAAALRGAARPLGLTAPMLRLLELYIDLTYDQDWTAGAEPIVSRPLIEIADRLGRSERQVRNIERALVDRGLLAFRDSGNHTRKGRRDHATGRLLWAYGPTLAPAGARAAEIVEAAAAERRRLAEMRRMRLAVSALRRRAQAALAGVTEAGVQAALRDAAAAPLGGSDLAALTTRRDQLTAALAALAAQHGAGPSDAPGQTVDPQATAHTTETTKTTGEEEIHDRHIRTTWQERFMNEVAEHPVTPPSTPARAERSQRIEHRTVLAAATERFRDTVRRNGGPTWRAVIDAARETAIGMGVDQAVWSRSCAVMGRDAAALSVIIMDVRADRIRHPAAYLKALAHRETQGRLRLDASIRGMMSKARNSDCQDIAGPAAAGGLTPAAAKPNNPRAWGIV